MLNRKLCLKKCYQIRNYRIEKLIFKWIININLTYKFFRENKSAFILNVICSQFICLIMEWIIKIQLRKIFLDKIPICQMEKYVRLWIGNEWWNKICNKEKIVGKSNGECFGQTFSSSEKIIRAKYSYWKWKIKVGNYFCKKRLCQWLW